MINMPVLRLAFQDAEKAILTRAKKGVAAVMVRDTKCTGLHILSDQENIPSALSAANQKYIKRAFVGSKAGKPSKVAVVCCGTDESLTSALNALVGTQVDYLAGLEEMTTEEVAEVQAWVLKTRETDPTLFAVLPECAADDRGIINYTSTVDVGKDTFGPGEYCSRIAGVLAGLPTTASATCVVLEEVTGVKALATEDKTEKEARNDAIDAGQLIVVYDGVKAKIARGVNSYVTLKAGEDDQLRKIKPTEAEGLVNYYSNLAIEDGYQGKSTNNYDDKCVLMEELRQLYIRLQAQGLFTADAPVGVEINVAKQRKYLQDNGVDTTNMSDQEVKRADTKSWVFWRGYGTFADCMEDFDGVFVRGGTATADAEA